MSFIFVSEASPHSLRRHIMQGKNRAKPRPDRRRQLTIPVEALTRAYNTLPPRLGSELSCTEFSEVEHRLFRQVMEFGCLSMRVLFPLAVLIDFSPDKSWFDPMRFDGAYLHLLLFAADVFIGTVVQGSSIISVQARQHFAAGVRLLRHQLSNCPVSDLMVRKVLLLVMSAQMVGDVAVAQHHLGGIHRIVELMGGIESLQERKLFFEIIRCDITLALQANSEPMFAEALKIYPTPDIVHSSTAPNSYGLNNQLHAIWSCMHHFCSVANLAGENKGRIPPNLLQDTVTMTMYGLLKMSFAPDSLDETVRLTLLSFCIHIFLQGQESLVPRIISKQSFMYIPQQPELRLWVLFIQEFSGTPMRECLRQTIRECCLTSWRGTREVLKRFLWVDVLCEREGKRVFSIFT